MTRKLPIKRRFPSLCRVRKFNLREKSYLLAALCSVTRAGHTDTWPAGNWQILSAPNIAAPNIVRVEGTGTTAPYF